MIFETSERDGSLSLSIRREGLSLSKTTWSTSPEKQDPKITEFDTPKPKNKRITIHQSGRVNYHENGNSIFIAPLTRTTQLFPIYGYRVPALEKLDFHNEAIEEEDAVFDLSELPEGPVSFSVLLGPGDFVPQGRAIKLGYEAEGYSVTVQVEPVTFIVPAELSEHFTTFTPERGLFPQQQMAEDQAMIAYHQALAGAPGEILYQPNGEGVIKMVFAVPMRIAPRFKIELADPALHVSDQDVLRDKRSEKVMLKFKVRHRKSKKIIRHAVEISSIELDAEL
ncbi:hypothetical protein [Aquabacterium sp.]|uniref:hypothetical protein n=1 Tax=Aquabacterium sp. TaxID=1872578 RepID=UPI0025C62370|nr:hypothetical protein [Aquabacterium sp.]